MFEQFDEETMKKALKRPFPVEKDVPDVFGRLLRRLSESDSLRRVRQDPCRCD